MESAWANAQPGDVFLLHGGIYGFVSDAGGQSGTPESPIVFKAFGDGEPIIRSLELANQSHIWFEGLTFEADGNEIGFYSTTQLPGYDNGFHPMSNDVVNIVLVRNTFRDFKHSIVAGARTSGWYIADNVIVGNMELGGESFDGEGVELAHGDNHIVAYNSITLVGDGVSFPDDNCDIYGNDIFDVTDDGIELDYGEANTRAWGNRIHNAAHNGISFQPMSGAPWYIVRNQIISYQESAFKFRDFSSDRYFAAHNTFVNSGWVFDHWFHNALRGITRNNLFVSVGNERIIKRCDGTADWRTDLDYDGFDWGTNSGPFNYNSNSLPDLESFTAVSGQEAHGMRVQWGSCFEALDVPGAAPHTTIPPQWATLDPACAAVDAGVMLPNVNDDHTGAAPDLGAYEVGHSLPHFGQRPTTPPDERPLPPAGLRVE
jgi:hypothetical protein